MKNLGFLFSLLIGVSGIRAQIISEIGTWHIFAGKCRIVAALGDTVFFTEGSCFKIADFHDDNNPHIIAELSLPSENYADLVLTRSQAYILSDKSLRVIDISDLFHPAEVAQTPIDWGKCLCLHSNYLYAGFGQ